MKKKSEKLSALLPLVKKGWLIMKLSLILIVLSVFSSTASVYSQSTRLSLKMDNQKISEIFDAIEQQTEFYFFYNKNKFDDTRRVSVDFQNMTIDEILKALFRNESITYEIFDRNILIKSGTEDTAETLRQQNIINGKVTDTKGSPLPGVTVVVKGKAQGTVTDVNGNYSLSNIPADAVLVFSFVGMKTQEIPLEGKTVINVIMAEESIGIDEVVAIGYGTVRRKDLTGSVASVKGGKLVDIPVTSAAQVITGQLAGVQVTQTDGSPDADIKIRVRGGGSITQDNSPLLLVDGFPVDNINNIAPTDIESIDVLKDASSTAIYGARGANGVLLITTKKGFEGKGEVSYNTYYGLKMLSKELGVLDPYNYVLYQLETLPLDNVISYFGDIRDWDLYKERRGTNWQDEALTGGFSLYNNISVRGGTVNTKYNISLTRNDEDEIMKYSGYSRTNLTANFTHKVNKWLTVDLNSMISDTYIKGQKVTESLINYTINNIVQYRPVNGIKDYIDSELVDPEIFDAYYISNVNPVDHLNDKNSYRRNRQLSFRFNGAATIELSKYLKYRLEFGQEYFNMDNNQFYGMTFYRSRLDDAPYAVKTLTGSRSYKMSNIISFSINDFLPGQNLSGIVGQEMNYSKAESLVNFSRYLPKYIDGPSAVRMLQLGTPMEITTTVNPRTTILSFFGRINYDFKKKYYFSATFRADGSSKFAPGNQWGYFPAFGASWNISEENFMKSQSWLDLLKLRASYGEAGNNRIAENAWQKTYSVKTGTLVFNDATQKTPFIAPGGTLSNSRLKWETTTIRNLGLDFAILNQRVSGSVELYLNKTHDLLINMTIPESTGYSKQWQNMGQTSNRGMEFALDGIIIDKKDLKVSVSFNIGFNKNCIDNLGGAAPWKESTAWASSYGGLDDYLIEEGGEIGQMFGYQTEGMYSFDDFNYDSSSGSYTLKEGVSSDATILGYKSNFGPGALKLKDIDGDLVVNEKDKVVIGNANPKHTGGFNLAAHYKGFDMSAFFNWVYGNDIYNASKINWSCYLKGNPYNNIRSFMTNYFRRVDPKTGTIVKDPSQLAELNKDADMWNPGFTFGLLHTWAVEDGSFLRLNTLTLGYTIPTNLTGRIGIQKIRIYASGYNLWMLTNYSGWDPEVDTQRSTPLTPGVDFSAYPRSRSINLGLNVDF